MPFCSLFRAAMFAAPLLLAITNFPLVGPAASAAPPAIPGIEPPPPPREPRVAAASAEPEAAKTAFGLPEGFAAEAWAAEPLLANPVAFSLDEQGRAYVCEAFRAHKGVGDNVRINDDRWLDADLANDTVDERFASMVRLLGDKAKDWVVETDRLRRVVDTDGDGRADTATVFATGFNRLLDGHGAGVLARRGDVFYACIPHLWRFGDADGDGVADEKFPLHVGYGVRTAIQGHDLHGLTLGPDGRLWFSIGDRGYHVEHEGGVASDPESGAVFRCEPDGSGLEVVATGLRNPQELAFDDLGNLFTCDNNTDGGDRTRLVHVVPGGDSGWRGPVQYLPDRGPFNREQLWRTAFDGQPAWILPPVGHLGAGPAGFAAYPGTGLTPWFDGRFFLADFRGAAATSLVHTFRVRPLGASFELVDADETFRHILATDVEMGPDGSLWVSDWVQGWEGDGKGRLWRFFPTGLSAEESAKRQAVVDEVRLLLAADWTLFLPEHLDELLDHPDRRLRREAQFEIARRHDIATLAAVAGDTSRPVLARVHAIQGLEQVARSLRSRQPSSPSVLDRTILGTLETCLTDGAFEVRLVAARTLGETRHDRAAASLLPVLADPHPHVRAAAGIALGRLGRDVGNGHVGDAVLPAIIAAIRAEGGRTPLGDPHARHPLVMALVANTVPDDLARFVTDPDPAVRLAACLAMRRTHDRAIATCLDDADPRIVVEAARAAYDVPIEQARSVLAGRLLNGPVTGPDGDAFTRRAIAACERLGAGADAERLAAFVTRAEAPTALRLQALSVLGTWAAPPPRDRVWGAWRPIAPRDPAPARAALQRALPSILSSAVGEAVQAEALKSAAALGVPGIGQQLVETSADTSRPAATRAAALSALATMAPVDASRIAASLTSDPLPEVRAAARRVRGAVLAATPDDAATRALAAEVLAACVEPATSEGELREQQEGIDLLKSLGGATGDSISALLSRLEAGSLDPRLGLEVIEAAGGDRQRVLGLAASGGGPLVGGDASRGRDLFLRKANVECVRCHAVGNSGGIVGPRLDTIGLKRDRSFLLESLLAPSAQFADGYRTTVVVTDEGRTVAGIVMEETDTDLRIVTGDGREERLATASIEDRVTGPSAMPTDIAAKLTPRELRDLVEWLAGLKGPATE
jgi:quinoprotein glucose dehydrogenase